MNSLKSFVLVAVITVLSLATGCKTVVRENVISSINTGVGISLAENPKTELYEAKVGFIRSQFYSVPTGKLVECPHSDTACKDCISNAADRTPNIVSGIRVESDLRHLLLGAKIAENFAVGDKAVMSPAAVAMYITHSPDKPTPETAKAAADGAKALSKISSLSSLDRQHIDILQSFQNFVTALPDGTPGKTQALTDFNKIEGIISGLTFKDHTQNPAVDYTLPPGLSGSQKFYAFRGALVNSIGSAPTAEKAKLEALLKRLDSDLAAHPGAIGLLNFTFKALNSTE